ncbi:unnamed protein product, partial [Brenthis ino]
MKSLLYLLVLVYAVTALPLDESEQEYSQFIEYADENGFMYQSDLQEKGENDILDEIARNPENNQYFLFTRRNPTSSQTLVINNANSITSSNFNARVPTVVLVHGWLGKQNTDSNSLIRDSYLRKSDVNVIVMDWRRLALNPYYPTAARGVPAVGRGLGQFLAFLNGVTGAPFNSMHLVGFSLGAHVVGNAGRELGGRIARITGLDPAGPLWSSNPDRLSPSHAIYVEAIHTDGGLAGLGIGSAVGNADFFPNGGTSQPGCLTSICDHNRAWELFAATVTYNHLVGTQCQNMQEVSRNTCTGSRLNMGNDDLNKRGNGLFRVNTERRYPF